VSTLERSLEKIAEQIIALDEASLSQLRKTYLDKVFNFEPSKKWEKAVIIYFIINGVIAKNDLFNRHILRQDTTSEKKGPDAGHASGNKKKRLRVIK